MTSSQPVFPESSRAANRTDAELEDLRAALEASRQEAQTLQREVSRHERTARREAKRRAALERRLQRAERRAQELESSTSYRLGHAIILVAKSPLLFCRWLAVRIVRLLAHVLPEDVRRWIADRTPERWRQRVRRATRSRGPRSPRTTGAVPGGSSVEESRLDEADRTGVLDSVRGRDPVFIFVLTPAKEDPGPVIDEVLTLRRAVGFVPVFITFSDDFAPFRQRRVAFEYVPPQEEWVARGLPGTWPAYYDQRLAEIVAGYGADDILPIPRPTGTIEAVTDVLTPLLVRRVVR